MEELHGACDGPAQDAHHTDYTDPQHLPVEVLTHILSFLPVQSRLSASCVSHHWYNASLHQVLHRDEAVSFVGDFFRPMRQLQDCPAKFQHFRCCQLDMPGATAAMQFWAHFGPKVRSLSFVACDMGELTLMQILSRCPALESLRIENCNSLMMSGNVLKTPVAVDLSSVVELHLGHNFYLSDAIFERLVWLMPKVKRVSLQKTTIAFHPGILARFYPAREPEVPASESLVTFLRVGNWISNNAERLTHIDFSNTMIDGNSLEKLASTPELKLESLCLRGCREVTPSSLVILCMKQPHIVDLHLSKVRRVNDAVVESICENLTNLRVLSLEGCQSVTPAGALKLSSLRHLTSLDLSDCNMDENTLIALVTKMPQMIHLKLNRCGVTDSVMVHICNLKHLRTLSICESQVTDMGITGREVTDRNEFPETMSLKTRAEKQLWEEHLLRRSAELDRERHGAGIPETARLNSLQKLVTLRLAGCAKVTDITCASLKFAHLQHLDLSSCGQVTDAGITHISQNNRCLEKLNLSRCHYVTDSGVEFLLTHLPHLRHLSLEGCQQITNATLATVTKAGDLRLLNIAQCKMLTLQGLSDMESTSPWLQLVCRSEPEFE